MGTIRQANALVMLWNKVRTRDGGVGMTRAEEETFRAEALQLTNADIQKVFANLNARLGFDRDRSPATDAQLAVLARWESRVYGRVRTTLDDHLTFTAAHDRIEALKRTHAVRTRGAA